MTLPNPALESFIGAFDQEYVLAEVFICRRGKAFEVRHVRDRDADPSDLREVADPRDFRALAQHTASGGFRPLKSAPNLPSGWRFLAPSTPALGFALDILYPGAVADWFAAQTDPPPVTHYREFTARQSGIYRVTQLLSDPQAAHAISACCHPDSCLKQRRWTVAGLEPDSPSAKSSIPCLEPCAVLLEFARKAARIEQAEMVTVSLEDARAMEAALHNALRRIPGTIREADFNEPSNPRRLRLALEKIRALLNEARPDPP